MTSIASHTINYKHSLIATALGNKMWCKKLSLTGPVAWIYYLGSTTQLLRRIMIF